MGDLTNDFSRWEFKCGCGCEIDDVSISFVQKLQKARTLAGIRFTINSGCRCPKHNKNEGGSLTSDHITTLFKQGEGIDVDCPNSKNRFKIIKAGLDAGFTRIGIGRTFVHLGESNTNTQEVIWLYK